MGSEWNGLEMNTNIFLILFYSGSIIPCFLFGLAALCSVYKPFDRKENFEWGDLFILILISFTPMINTAITVIGIIVGIGCTIYIVSKHVFGSWWNKPVFPK